MINNWGADVLHYLARYTHRTVISNHRLLSFDGKEVAFRWNDYGAFFFGSHSVPVLSSEPVSPALFMHSNFQNP